MVTRILGKGAGIGGPPGEPKGAGGLLEPADLSEFRFGHSAVWETAAVVYAVRGRADCALHTRRLRRAMTPRAGKAFERLRPLAVLQDWTLDTWSVAPGAYPGGVDFDAVRDAPTATICRDLEMLQRCQIGTSWARMGPGEFAATLADALGELWRELLHPVWDRILTVQAADVSDRLRDVASGGLRQALSRIHPGLRVVDPLDHAPGDSNAGARAARCGVVLVPSVFRWSALSVSLVDDGPIVVGYPATAAGTIWEPEARGDQSLNSLIGRTRTVVLTSLGRARTTTDLARELGFAPSTVNTHLTILTSTGLVDRVRVGREVRYARTRLGGALLGVDAESPTG